MNLGGEPERDDSGLPPVDIEVPDDARELDRDVQAYRRELRARRRRQRRMRLRGPLTRDGVLLPLLASCLVLALIAGTLLTVFTAGPGGDLPGATQTTPPAGTSSRPPTSAPAGTADSPIAVAEKNLPDQAVKIGGKQVPLQTLTPAVLALVPAGCGCTSAVRRLVGQAVAAGVPLYLVSAKGGLAAVRQLVRQAPGQSPVVKAAEDFSGALYTAYPPAGTGLTAVLARKDGSVTVAAPLQSGFRLNGQLSNLRATASASPAPTTTATTP